MSPKWIPKLGTWRNRLSPLRNFKTVAILICYTFFISFLASLIIFLWSSNDDNHHKEAYTQDKEYDFYFYHYELEKNNKSISSIENVSNITRVIETKG